MRKKSRGVVRKEALTRGEKCVAGKAVLGEGCAKVGQVKAYRTK